MKASLPLSRSQSSVWARVCPWRSRAPTSFSRRRWSTSTRYSRRLACRRSSFAATAFSSNVIKRNIKTPKQLFRHKLVFYSKRRWLPGTLRTAPWIAGRFRRSWTWLQAFRPSPPRRRNQARATSKPAATRSFFPASSPGWCNDWRTPANEIDVISRPQERVKNTGS